MRTISRTEAAKMIEAIGGMTTNSSPLFWELLAQLVEGGWTVYSHEDITYRVGPNTTVEFKKAYDKIECQDACMHVEEG